MKFAYLILLAIAWAGCTSVPLDEINFSGKPLAAGVDPYVEAERFATVLAREAQVQVVDFTKHSGSGRVDAKAEVDLKRDRTSKVLLRVIVDAAQREVWVIIQPGSKTPLSEELAAAAIRSYRELYGDSEFSRRQRYQGLFGP